MYNEKWMKCAHDKAKEALENEEVPVGCVIVRNGVEIIATGRNKTNETRNATRHAEMVAIDSIFHSQHEEYDLSTILRECELYVTVEPCIMCAAALRELQINRVYFGCLNDRFGGNGSVLSVHSDQVTEQVVNMYPPYQSNGGYMELESVILLRQFYLLENTRAPVPKKKTHRVLKMHL